MPGISTVKRCELHARTSLNDWICRGVQIQTTVSAFTRPQLFAGDGEGAIHTITNEDRPTRTSNKDLRVYNIINLDLVTIIQEENTARVAINDIERLTIDGSGILG